MNGRALAVMVGGAVAGLAGAGVAAAQPGPETAFSAEPVASGLERPVFFTAAPGDAGGGYVAEAHTGAIRRIDLRTGATSEFFRLPAGTLSTGNEQGLLGLAFDPGYADNGRFYVNFTDAGGDTVVRRYAPNGSDAAGRPAFVGTDLLTVDQPFANHNAGWIGFNPAGGPSDANNLYVALGDGGSANDPRNLAQDLSSPLGSILRVDVSGDTAVAAAGNPFVGVAGADARIFAYGLRNPYRAAFDRATGDLYVGDVGQDTREEIDLIPAGTAGQNFGWRVREGDIATPGVGGPDRPGFTDPLYDYTHDFGAFGGLSVTGGVLYRGSVDELVGRYLFADFVSQNIWALDPDNPDASVENITELLAGDGNTLGGISSFGEDLAGEVYVVNLAGDVFRVVPEPGTGLAAGALTVLAFVSRRRVTARPAR